MPAATLRIDDVATHTNFRQWVATPSSGAVNAGQSIDVTVALTTGGVAPAAADTLTLNVYNDLGTLVRSYALTPGQASQTVTFHFTDTGQAGGSPRCGTVELAIRATRGNPNPYDVETDGGPNTPGTGNDSHLTRGWARADTTLVEDVSNTGLGQAPNLPAAYDDSLFVRAVAGAVSYVARTLTVATSDGGLSSPTNSTTAVTRDVTFASVVDERFPAAVTPVGVTVTVPVASVSGSPDWVFTSTTDDTLDVDPRLRCSAHHFQVNDPDFALAKHDPSKQMLSTDIAYTGTRIVNARGEGVNGIGGSHAYVQPDGQVYVSRSFTTATRDGQAGWTQLSKWDASKPGGAWTCTYDVTSPADIDGAAYLLDSVDSLTLLAEDPRIAVIVTLAPTSTSEDDHLHPGDDAEAVVTFFSRETWKRLAPDVGTVEVGLVRWAKDARRFEYLQAGGATWAEWAGTATEAAVFAMLDEGDGVTFTQLFDTTSGWTASDVVAVAVTAKIGGTPYGFYVGRELLGAANGHQGYALDAFALAMSGVLSQR